MTEIHSTAAFSPHRHTDRCRKDPVRYTWTCPVDAAGSSAAGGSLDVDIRDMLVLHAALAREFRLAPAAVARVEPSDRKQARYVDEHLTLICDMLHEHHGGEDEILWPVLRPRLSVDDARLLDKIESQHADINDSIEQVNTLRRRWLDEPSLPQRDALSNELQTLYDLVTEHLEDEERDILPLAEAYMSEREWRAINDAGLTLSPKMLLLAAGLCCYGTDRELVQVILGVIPAPLRPAVIRIGGFMYARRAARVYGTKRP
ncbi:hemerythrin domain-containing protein [Mycolicibacterium septicum]|uniref:hemerythrin domain-containing protein n=1 Tax=Mycolicibacterium septicum TaxID=98668 RepID=UPI002360C844|nr:hemerythrin domain-containing protein [Mycolicibacterium septicum]